MDKIQILGIGRDPVVLQTLLRFINESSEWEGTGTVDDESALTLFAQKKYDLVLLIDYLPEASEEKFRNNFTESNPQVVFLKHYSDSTALLASELYETLQGNPVLQKTLETKEPGQENP